MRDDYVNGTFLSLIKNKDFSGALKLLCRGSTRLTELPATASSEWLRAAAEDLRAQTDLVIRMIERAERKGYQLDLQEVCALVLMGRQLGVLQLHMSEVVEESFARDSDPSAPEFH